MAFSAIIPVARNGMVTMVPFKGCCLGKPLNNGGKLAYVLPSTLHKSIVLAEASSRNSFQHVLSSSSKSSAVVA